MVTAPARATVERLNAIVRGKAFWVTQRLRRATASPTVRPAGREFVSGETFHYLGRQYRLRVVAGPGVDVKLNSGWIAATVPELAEPARPRAVRDALVRWYRAHAEARLPERAAHWARRFGISAPAVLIRDQRRRWGSCNQAGEVRLNWRIIQAPLSLVDYVVAHELAHALRGDDGHSLAFWAQLGRVMPDYDARRDRLRELGPSLEW